MMMIITAMMTIMTTPPLARLWRPDRSRHSVMDPTCARSLWTCRVVVIVIIVIVVVVIVIIVIAIVILIIIITI